MKAIKKKSFKLPKLQVWGYDSSAATKQVIEELRAEHTKLYALKADAGAPKPTWDDVSHLIANQLNMLQVIANLQEVLEDPSVAHAMSVKHTLDDLRARLQEVTDDLARHERCNDHERNGNYY